MSKQWTLEERRRLAEMSGANPAYLYQCLTGRREMGPVEARKLEAATNCEIRPWHVCQKTWFLIWPELIGTEGAPKVNAKPAPCLKQPKRRQRGGAQLAS
jgi:DNA-binding transcriptional regulator YdaS (Cro superfamily)